MQLVQPEIYLVAEPRVHFEELQEFLSNVGAPEWKSLQPASDAEMLVEVMGRQCYRSFAPGLNANVTRVREGNQKYIQEGLIGVLHGSVLEHAQVSFIFRNVSRVFTHELVRHRVGVGISQESLRFVRLDNLGMWIPEWALNDRQLMGKALALVEEMESFQKWMAIHFDLDKQLPGEDQKAWFDRKKFKTSFMRRFAPDGLATSIGWSANFRTLRAVIEQRTSRHAEEEIRLVFGQVAELCQKTWPAIFADYKVEMVNDYAEWTTPNRKV